MNLSDWQPAVMFVAAIAFMALGAIFVVRRWNGRR